MALAQNQRNAIKFYEGDIAEENKDDTLFGDSKIYATINAMFFDGTENEMQKHAEGKRLNPSFIDRFQDLVEVDFFGSLFSAFNNSERDDVVTYRVDRLSNVLEMLKFGKTISFTSTCKNGFLSSYGDKNNIILIEFHIPKEIPHIDFEKVLDSYAKKEEAEVLLPPGIEFKYKKAELSESEKQILDYNGNPPKAKYIFVCTGVSMLPYNDQKLCEEDKAAAIEFIKNLNSNIENSEKEMYSYLRFKSFALSVISKAHLKSFSKNSWQH